MEFSVTEADYAAAFLQSGLTEAHRQALAKLKDNRLRCLALLEMAYVNLPAEEAEQYAARVAELSELAARK